MYLTAVFTSYLAVLSSLMVQALVASPQDLLKCGRVKPLDNLTADKYNLTGVDCTKEDGRCWRFSQLYVHLEI